MEGMNGIDVLKQIKRINPATIVYIITGQENPQVAVQAMDNGASDYVVKSTLSPDKMKTLMENVEATNPVIVKESKKSFFGKVFGK